MLNLNYDAKFDILYVRKLTNTPSYGEDEDGIVTFFGIEDDEITGMAIFDAKQRFKEKTVSNDLLPIPIDFYGSSVRRLIFHPECGFSCTLNIKT